MILNRVKSYQTTFMVWPLAGIRTQEHNLMVTLYSTSHKKLFAVSYEYLFSFTAARQFWIRTRFPLQPSIHPNGTSLPKIVLTSESFV
ncbi:hypothetical protein VCRA2114E365_260005 [Vibrio crassostreae]|nr:hypothetical protein VCRA2115O371_240074 [Vibrio crassostreae]CAK1937409.1 hypothetical protein VCRA2116O26_260005 [Vibrio crassostreae]CAK1938085.1 hypothetical protein VCRA2117O376_250005 [Vibrio crassostreae]CAK1939612.1 hypothetical protein VCRA2117O378_270005 [Vibrio crassostreae]CAK1942350.1 hypothetical protein VCRA2113O351_250054 [Vibrio crassostreae]